MKIWLSKNSEVSVREQLITQITIGISSGDLPVGEKLPSTREISRRFEIHANTVSNAYQELTEQGWLDFKKGSGFFIKENKAKNGSDRLDFLAAEFIKAAQLQGLTNTEIKKIFSRLIDAKNPDHFVVIESDENLQRILVTEIAKSTNANVSGISFESFQQNPASYDAILVALPDETVKINELLPPNKTCVYLQTTSVAESLTGHNRPDVSDLIAVASGWDRFLFLAKTMLLAAQIDAESLIVRSTNFPDWKNGLDGASIIICDSLVAEQLVVSPKIRVFNLISQLSLTELREMIA